MPAGNVVRSSSLIGPAGRPNANSVRVDGDTDTFKFGTGASGTTEKEAADLTSTQTVSGKTLTNPVINSAMVAGGSTLTLTAASHDGKTIALDTAAGTTITLPAASGSGARFRFVVTVAATSNQHRINVVGNDAFFGNIFGAQDGGVTVEAWEAAADADQINLNGTTTGGLKGDWIELEDMVADGWSVRGLIAQTGVQATPFSTGQVS
jgi:hypothetical protein